MTLLHLFWEVISYHKYSETTSPRTSARVGGAPSGAVVADVGVEAAAHRSLRLLPTEPPLFWDICRRRSWGPPATSTSTRTTCSIWQTNTGKVKPPLCTSVTINGPNIQMSHLRSSPKQRKNRDFVLQVQNQTRLLHVAPKPVV